MYKKIAFLLIASVAIAASVAAEPPVKGQKAVLVTGASTGIGRNIAERLAGKGYFVYATARKDADLKALGAIKNVQAVKLDVTNPQDIAAAVDVITRGGRGLYALVNNAGVGTLGPVMQSSDAEFDLTMQVNLYGPYRVTKAFAPLIVAEKGRITTIGSISGVLAVPGMSAYSMSKHAVEAFTDSLAAEMQAQGVTVSVIEPGNYDSAIATNAVTRLGADQKLGDRSKYKQPDEVSDAVEHALFDAAPKRRYMVVPNEEEGRRTIEKQIAQLVELNEGHAYTYDRDALVKMLDEKLKGSRPRTAAK
jgi:NAD(P)-dependent dehydrogenase (short-subunit alcohol dehydrogenase family)